MNVCNEMNNYHFNRSDNKMNSGTIIKDLCAKFPCRENVINYLHQLIGDGGETLPRALFVHGHSAVGKTAIVLEYLKLMEIKYAYINCVECYTQKLLHESIISQLYGEGTTLKCDSFMDLIHYLKRFTRQENQLQNIFIVLDGVEFLQDLKENYLPAFCSLQNIISFSMISVIFISHIMPEKFAFDSSVISLYFPQYSKDDLMEILKLTRPADCPETLYDNYLNSVLTTFWRITRDLTEMKFLVLSNFEHYFKPVKDKVCNPENVAALWKNILPYFKESLNTVYSGMSTQSIERFQYDPQKNAVVCNKGPSVLDLPYYAKYFLIAAYLASYNLPKHDKRLFLKYHGKKRKRLTSKQVKEKRTLELVGPKVFTLDRLLAIFYAIMEEKASLTVNLVTQISTLVELKLLARLGDSNLDCPKFKCLIGLQAVESVARTLGFNIKKYLLEP